MSELDARAKISAARMADHIAEMSDEFVHGALFAFRHFYTMTAGLADSGAYTEAELSGLADLNTMYTYTHNALVEMQRFREGLEL